MTQPTTYTCNVCQYRWLAKPGLLQVGRKEPRKCPNCQSTQWNKKGD